MITREEFISLYAKFLSGECTAEERQLLNAYRDEMSLPDMEWPAHLGNQKEIQNRIRLRLKQSRGIHTLNRVPWIRIAAAVFVIVSCALIIWKLQQMPVKNTYAVSPQQKPGIKPGSNKAYLTLANGTVISLNDARNGKLSAQSGMQIIKANNGVLVYHAADKVDSRRAPVLANTINTITTPRGGQYQVELSDGTRVWLNSASSLKYPAVFTGTERRVELSGEAYFEVAKNPAKPFKVAANGINVQVFGTHFNVLAYNDEKNVKATLLEGSVKLSNGGHDIFLKPGQQGIANPQTIINVLEVNVEDEVAWKNGLFAFNNESIQTIMRQIARWYDVDVVFSEKIVRKNFGGTVSRFEDVTEVLRALELTGSVHFKIEGRRITVMP